MKKLLLVFILEFFAKTTNAQTDTTFSYIYECDGCGTFETISANPVDMETSVIITTQVLPDSGKSTLAEFSNSVSRKAAKTTDKKNETLFNVYPNPCRGNYFLNFQSEESGTATVYLFNLLGTELWKKEFELKQGMNVIEEKANLHAGSYFVKAVFNGKSFTRKIAFLDSSVK